MANFNLFGIQLGKQKPVKENPLSVVPPNSEDGSTIVTTASGAANYYGLVLDMDSIVKNENDLIRRYREIAQYSDCDAAITDIVNETIVTDDDKSIEIKLDNLNVSDAIKQKITIEFEEVLRLLDFEEFGPDIFRQWYIDGRVYYQVLIDPNNIKAGIQELRKIDPRKIRKIKNVVKQRNEKGVEIVKSVDEFYLYNDKGINEQTAQGVKMTLDSVIYCPSGLIDPNSGMTLGHLHKAVKPTNQLKMIEDAVVIYRISRAPERRIFYIDVGNLPKLKAEQYVNDIMNKFRNKIVYDATTGETRDDRRHLCLSMDTKVPLLDGRTLTLSEISEEYKSKELWAYSCDPITGKFVPGLITWAGVSRPDAEVMRLTLDNGETIICTPDHKFPVWNKNLVQAKDLIVGDSMIPLYRRNQPVDDVLKLLSSEDSNDPSLTVITIAKIEYLDERIDTGCLTIDGDEIYHNHHTFALDAGIYTQNSMMEDFWMPRREGGKGTEITTLPGGQTLGQIEDVQYFQQKLYQALNVPLGRLQPQQGFSLGRSTEITREEVKFNKFITRLRKKFANLLADALRINLVCKGIIREDEWAYIKQYIQFDYQRDNYFTELKDSEILMNRLQTLQQISPYIGQFYSYEWVAKNVLNQSDEDIKMIAAQNAENPPITPEQQG